MEEWQIALVVIALLGLVVLVDKFFARQGNAIVDEAAYFDFFQQTPPKDGVDMTAKQPRVNEVLIMLAREAQKRKEALAVANRDRSPDILAAFRALENADGNFKLAHGAANAYRHAMYTYDEYVHGLNG